jgi:hypothetical protein
MDLTKWTKLWEKFDALGPDGLVLTDHGAISLLTEADGGETTISIDIPYGTAEAMIHARANTYLADTDREPCLHAIGFDDAKTYEVTIWDRNDDERISFPADSPVEAYYFACCYFIGVEP